MMSPRAQKACPCLCQSCTNSPAEARQQVSQGGYQWLFTGPSCCPCPAQAADAYLFCLWADKLPTPFLLCQPVRRGGGEPGVQLCAEHVYALCREFKRGCLRPCGCGGIKLLCAFPEFRRNWAMQGEEYSMFIFKYPAELMLLQWLGSRLCIASPLCLHSNYFMMALCGLCQRCNSSPPCRAGQSGLSDASDQRLMGWEESAYSASVYHELCFPPFPVLDCPVGTRICPLGLCKGNIHTTTSSYILLQPVTHKCLQVSRWWRNHEVQF